ETGRSNFTPRRTRMNLFGKPTCAGRFGRNCGTTPNPNGGGRGSVSSRKASGFLSPRVRADSPTAAPSRPARSPKSERSFTRLSPIVGARRGRERAIPYSRLNRQETPALASAEACAYIEALSRLEPTPTPKYTSKSTAEPTSKPTPNLRPTCSNLRPTYSNLLQPAPSCTLAY